MILNYSKEIQNTEKFQNQMEENFESYESFTISGTNLSLTFSGELTQEEQYEVEEFVDGFVNYATVEQLQIYLDTSVFPFIKEMINTFAAENIAMGITVYGKTHEVLGLFTKKYAIEGHDANYPISLKGAFDTGSLHCALDIIEHVRLNEDISGISPFVTDARLLVLKNKIEDFLGIPRST